MWPNPQETGDLVTFTEEILNGKLYFCAVFVCKTSYSIQWKDCFGYKLCEVCIFFLGNLTKWSMFCKGKSVKLLFFTWFITQNK